MEGLSQAHPRPEALPHPTVDDVGLAAEHGETLLVHDRAVVLDVVQLILAVRLVLVAVLVRYPHLRHQDLDLERLHLVGEDLVEGLRVRVRERAGVDVLT